MKIVLNKCFGGFGLSDKAWREIHKRGLSHQYDHEFEMDRSNPVLIEVVERLGSEANGRNAELKVVELPDDVYWYKDEYDGIETIIYSESPIHAV
jgi:hypothetical protein